MQRAGQKRTGNSLTAKSPSPPAPDAAPISLRLLDVDAECDADAECGADTVSDAATDRQAAAPLRPRQEALAALIRQRIETRLRGRVRNLVVQVEADVVTLEGQCATFYTKQIAQHTAMGVLDDEHLENGIVVNVPR